MLWFNPAQAIEVGAEYIRAVKRKDAHMPTVEARIKDIIVSQLGVKLEKVTDEARLIEDLGADSLDLIELTMVIEEEFRGDIPEEEANKLLTVKQVVAYVEKAIAEAKEKHAGGWRE